MDLIYHNTDWIYSFKQLWLLEDTSYCQQFLQDTFDTQATKKKKKTGNPL